MQKEEISSSSEVTWKPNQWMINAVILILAIPVSYKIAVTPFSLQIDLNGLLSLLLALFSVGLSAMFYFKANETSNGFYDNTYKFTKDIAELLVRIESGFGERLKHIDEGYSSMRDYMQTSTAKPHGNVEKTKQKIESEEQEIEKVLEERNKIIQQLVERSQLQDEEKTQFTAQLKAKEEELANVQHEISKLNTRLALEKASKRIQQRESSNITENGFKDFTNKMVIREIGVEKLLSFSPLGIRRYFEKLEDNLPEGYIRDMEKRGLYRQGLTTKGVEYFKNLAVEYEEK